MGPWLDRGGRFSPLQAVSDELDEHWQCVARFGFQVSRAAVAAQHTAKWNRRLYYIVVITAGRLHELRKR
jgi:hypothetical protein